MKKTLFLPIAILLVVLPLVLSETAIEPTKNTGTAYGLNKNFFNFFPTQTVVGGFRCSDNIDVHYRMTTGGLPHPAGFVSFPDFRTYRVNVWRWNPWSLVEEIDVIKGQGIINRNYAFEFDYAYFYCDIAQITCQEISPYVNSGCCGEGKVLRKRQVQELTSGGCSGWETQSCLNALDFGASECYSKVCVQVVTKACNPLTKEIKEYGTPCDVPSGWTTDLSQCPNAIIQQPVDFELSGLKRITGFDAIKTNNLALNFKLLSGETDIYSINIKNTGTQTSGTQLEIYYVSKTNPFYNVIQPELRLTTSLQAFLEIQGITENPQTCKNEQAVASYTIEPLASNEQKDFFIAVPKPKKTDSSGLPIKLAGNDNYNENGQYLVVVDAYDNCQNANIYDAIGGTKNFKLGGGDVPDENANNTPYDSSARQLTIKRENIQSTTATDLLKYACTTNDVCKSDTKCEPIQSLIESGFITETKAKDDIKNQKRILADATGGTAGAISAAFLGAKGGLAICSAFGAGTLGFGMPICFGVLTVGGAIVGGTLGDAFYKVFLSRDSENLNEAGYCVPKEETSGFSWDKFINSIGKGVNEAFGGKAKTGLENTTMGYIVLVVAGIIIIIILLSGRK